MTHEELIISVQQVMLQNRKTFGEYQYTVPSLDSYPFQWLWDSCFHVIILSKCGQIEDAQKELVSLVSHQFENGMLSHMIYWDKLKQSAFPIIKWGKNDTSTVTQPPMIAYATKHIYDISHDKKFLEQLYPHLRAYYEFLLVDRESQGIHLLGIVNPDESGEDNSPRFDSALGLTAKQTTEESFSKRLKLVEENLACRFDTGHCMSNFFWVKDVPFNVIMIQNLRELVSIARILEYPEDELKYTREVEEMELAMRRWMYADGVFWPTIGQNMEKVMVKTWHIFAPLFAHIYTPAEADAVVKNHFWSDSFNTRFGVPTVATDEPSYDPKGFWRGPVWMSTNWFIYRGLMNYGFYREAEKVKQSSLQILEKSGFREQFRPDTGEGMGAEGFTWGGLVLDME